MWLNLTLANNLLPVVDKLRGIAGKLGFRPFTVQVVRRIGGQPGVSGGGNFLDTVGQLPSVEIITQIQTIDGYAPKVRQLNTNDFARGYPASAEIEVGPITPAYDGGGYDFEDLEPLLSGNQDQIFYRVFGPGYPAEGAWFVKTQFNAQRALGFFLVLERTNDGTENL